MLWRTRTHTSLPTMLLVCFAPACEEGDGSVDIHRMGPCTLCYLSNLLRCLVTRQGSVQQECGRTLPQADLQTLLCEVNSTVHQALEVPAVKRTDTKYVRMLPAAQNCNTYINTIRYHTVGRMPEDRNSHLSRVQELQLTKSAGLVSAAFSSGAEQSPQLLVAAGTCR